MKWEWENSENPKNPQIMGTMQIWVHIWKIWAHKKCRGHIHLQLQSKLTDSRVDGWTPLSTQGSLWLQQSPVQGNCLF